MFLLSRFISQAGCVLDHCFIGDNVTLEENVILSPGCILGKGVILGPKITVPRATCLVATPPIDEFDQQISKQGKNCNIHSWFSVFPCFFGKGKQKRSCSFSLLNTGMEI